MVRLATGKTEDESAELGSIPDVPVMTGTHFHALDDKARVIIPAKLRPALGERFWLMRTRRNNVGIFPYETGLDIIREAEERQAEHPDDEMLAAALEQITDSAELVEAESGWRVSIPDILRLFAGLEKEVVTVGVLNHAELWSRERWVKHQESRLEQSEEIGRLHAEIMRAGASGTRRKAKQERQPDVLPAVEHVNVAATGANAANAGAAGLATGTDGAGRVAPAASTGDGGRSKSVLSFANIGR
jgi:MraZ protein